MPHMSPACSGRMQQARRVVSREIACRPQSAACAAASVAAVAAHGCKQSGCRSASTRGGPPRHRCPLGSGRAAAWHHCDSAKAEPELAHRRRPRRQLPSARSVAASSCCLQLRPEGAVPEAGPGQPNGPSSAPAVWRCYARRSAGRALPALAEQEPVRAPSSPAERERVRRMRRAAQRRASCQQQARWARRPRY